MAFSALKNFYRLFMGIALATFAMSGEVLAANDTTAPDCAPLGPITLLSGSGIRIEVDGENGGCNETGDRYNYGNVIGPVRVYPGYDAVTGSNPEELLFDEPLEFVRLQNPVRGTHYVARWTTRRGFVVIMTFNAVRFRQMNVLKVNEFLVYENEEQALRQKAFYQEWGNTWTQLRPGEIKGRVAILAPPPLAPITNARISLFHCRALDGLADSTVTDEQGGFFFPINEGGYYQLRVEPPEGFSTEGLPATGLSDLYANGFTPCVDYRPSVSDRSLERTGGLFSRRSNGTLRSSWEFRLPRAE